MRRQGVLYFCDRTRNILHLIKKILLLNFCVLLCISCNQTSSEACGGAWVGGEVVNPKRDYVIISKSRTIVDTVPLDDKNFFLYQFEQVDPGVYFFIHNEYQAMYLEPGDSIMLRVNTLEFDESLYYTGKGSEKNNFMMEMFLMNERENEMVTGFYLLNPSEFEQKMDSFAKVRLELYKEFVSKKQPSAAFKEVAEAAVHYDIYSKKELYVSAISRKKNYDATNEDLVIPMSFYDFRKNVDYGNDRLRDYYPYYRYLSYHLDNLAFNNYEGEALFDRFSYVHNYHKNILIDSLITNENLKNRMLRTGAHKYFLNAKHEEEEVKMLNQFLSLSTNEEDHQEIRELAKAMMRLTPGHTIPNQMLLTTDNTVKDLHSAINGPTVIYFWSNQSVKHYKNIHTRASELKSKYPEYNFIGINLDAHFKKWLKIVKNSGYDALTEYQFENFDDAEMKLIIDSVNKAMIVDENGTILNGNTNIFDRSIEEELLGYLNQT